MADRCTPSHSACQVGTWGLHALTNLEARPGRRVAVRHRDDHPQGARSKSRYEWVVDLHEAETLATVSAYVMGERPTDADSRLVFLIGGRGTRRLEALSYDGLVWMFSRACTGPEAVGDPARSAAHSCDQHLRGRHTGTDATEATWSRFSRIDMHLDLG